MKKFKVIVLILLLILGTVGVLFYYKNDVLNLYNKTSGNLQQFSKTEIGNIVTEFKKEVLTSTPLKVVGKESNAVFTKEKIIAQTNIQRYNNEMLPPLIENAKLNAAAKAKAEDMFLKQYFEHISPSGVDPGTLVKNFGYDYIVAGENLILGNFASEQEVVQNWMNSPGHRANILNNRVIEIGVAIIKGTYEGYTVWMGVQEFGLPLSVCSQPGDNLKNQIDVNKNQLDQISSEINSKKAEIDNTNQRSSKYNQLADEYNQLVVKYNQLVQETKNLILQYNNQVNIFNECVKGSPG